MTFFHNVNEGWVSNCHVIDQNDHHNEQDLFVLRYPFIQLDASVRYGSCPWRYLRFYYQYIKRIFQDLRFDQVVGLMSHHPIQRNTIIPKACTDYMKGFGVSNRIMCAGVSHISFFVQHVLSRGKLFRTTRPSWYNTFSWLYTPSHPDPRDSNHVRLYP